MEDFKILESVENEDGSLLISLELSEFVRDLLIDKGINTIFADCLNENENVDITISKEVLEFVSDWLIEKGFNAILVDYLNEIENKEKS